MKKIKLSGKLLIALVVVLFGIIFYQVIVTSQVFADSKNLKDKQTVAELRSALEKTHSYKRINCDPFSKIKIEENQSVVIIKGDKFEVYYSENFNVTVKSEGGILKIGKRDENESWSFDRNYSVYVFLPEELESISVSNNYFASCSVFGFEGTKTQLLADSYHFRLVTDMSQINIRQRNNQLEIFSQAMDSTVVIDKVNLVCHSDSSTFQFRGNKVRNLNADLQIHFGDFNLWADSAKVGTVKVNGSLRGHRPDDKNATKFWSNINFNTCDSLMLQLNCREGDVHPLGLVGTTKPVYEDLQLSNNIVVKKTFKTIANE